jgi:cytochrome c oxidase cbb3-type subunit 1
VIRWGVIATVFWGVAGFLVGVVIAFQLAYPQINLEPWFNFGRMRPLHTSAVIFAFGGNALIATSFYVVQRTCRARLAFPASPVSSSGVISFSSCWPPPDTCWASRRPRNMPSGMACRPVADLVWVAYLVVFGGTIISRGTASM